MKNKTIIVVEHDDSNYILIQEYLCSFAIHLIRCCNGYEIIDLVKSNNTIDLLLLDLYLIDGLDGFEVTKIIKTIKPDLPVVFHTAYVMSGDKEKCLDCGCDDYISKPYSMTNFCNIVSKYLNQYDYKTTEAEKD